MNNYYFHGIEAYPGAIGYAIQILIKILNEGILVRSKARDYKDASFNHVCLFKKNEDVSYDDEKVMCHSAFFGWIHNGFVVVINPNIDARKASVPEETDLIDEWRCYSDIPVSEFVAIALPYDAIHEYLDSEHYEEDEEDIKLLRDGLKEVSELAKQLGLPIYDSSQRGFSDNIDTSIKQNKM